MRFFKTRQYYMLDMVASFLEKNKDELYKRTPVLRKLIPEYQKQFKVVHDTVTGKMRPTAIETGEKRTARDGLITISLDLIDMIRSYSSSNKGGEMPPAAFYTFSKLKRAKIEEFVKMSRQIIDAAKKVPDISEYGLSEGDIKEAEAYLKEFTAVKKAPALRKQELAENNALINGHISGCILFLENNLDPVMRIATKHNEKLKRGYFSFRKVLLRAPGNIRQDEAKYRKSRKKAQAKARAKRVAKKT